jgi:eukaryotic-like serine/threonine-protein kinase
VISAPPLDKVMTLTANTLLQNRYLVVQPIGQGGMGAVYLAIDQRLGHTVALKETLYADRDELAKAFEREARLLARLRHPALPSVSDHFAEEDRQFLVMEYIAGDDLSTLIAKNGKPFEFDRVLAWADSLLDALDYLHSHNPPVVHRDIKPQNLKLTGRDQIILLDFGLAKGHAEDVSRFTAAPVSLYGYTPRYAPLEQIKGTGTEARSDLYSLAATLYHLMTNIAPPDALTRVEAIVENRPDPLRRADELNAEILPDVASILERALNLNRDERYVSAHAMRSDLREAAGPIIEAAKNRSFAAFVTDANAPTQITAQDEEVTAVNQQYASGMSTTPLIIDAAVAHPRAATKQDQTSLMRRQQ